MNEQTPFWMKNAKQATPVVAPPMSGKTSLLPIGPAVTQAEAEAAEPCDVLPPEALAVIRVPGMAPATAAQLKQAFGTAFGDAPNWLGQAAQVRVTDAAQTGEMAKAKEIRLKLKAIRCAVENVRKDQKADSLMRGKVIDGIANAIKGMIEPAEKYLQEQEEFAERAERKRVDELRAQRFEALRPYINTVADTAGVDLAYLTPEAFDAMLEGAKLQAHQRAEAERTEAEARRIKEESDRAERERLAAENERLRKDQAEKDAENRRLREDADRAEADRRAKEEADRKAAAAPDREKLLALAATLRGLPLPEMATDRGRALRGLFTVEIHRLAAMVESKATSEL